jgi:hypothetical protein
MGSNKHYVGMAVIVKPPSVTAKAISSISPCHAKFGIESQCAVPQLDGLDESPDVTEAIRKIGENLALVHRVKLFEALMLQCATQFEDLC